MEKWIILIVVVAMAFGGLWVAHDQYIDMKVEKTIAIINELDAAEKLNIFIDHEYGERYYGVLDDYTKGDTWYYYRRFDVNRDSHDGLRVVSEYYVNTVVYEHYLG